MPADESGKLRPQIFGAEVCRACHATDLQSILDLGPQPLANRLLPELETPDPKFPLHLRICRSCLLGQVGDVVAPNEIFSNYPYLSSMSTSWLEHCRKFVSNEVQSGRLSKSGYILELASNDGYLLEMFQGKGYRVLGVEPAENVAKIAQQKGIPTISQFFGTDLARAIALEHGVPDLIIANNVLAHVPDPQDFARGLALLCDSSTRISIENPSFLGLLLNTQFDTIYHEHYSYLSVNAVHNLVQGVGMQITAVEDLPTHGGSYRYWIQLAGQEQLNVAVLQRLEDELTAGLNSRSTWEEFALRSTRIVDDLRTWLQTTEGPLAAYGAAAKGSTLLNSVGDACQSLSVVFDASPEKAGKFMPGSLLPIWHSSRLRCDDWSHMLILPWNISREIAQITRSKDPGITLWRAIPSLARIDGK